MCPELCAHVEYDARKADWFAFGRMLLIVQSELVADQYIAPHEQFASHLIRYGSLKPLLKFGEYCNQNCDWRKLLPQDEMNFLSLVLQASQCQVDLSKIYEHSLFA